jgi:membrane-bound metal-dependent hydrolase YbcI (DUF457 family)
MAGFHTHIAVSTAAGVAYGWWGATQLGLPMPACTLAGGLCAISGMFPDLDSDSGVPARETISFAAAVVPMLAFHRLHLHGLSVEQMVVAGAPMYLFIRFGLGSLLKKFTVHRGMFHSIPALLIASMITFLICDDGLTTARFFKAGGVALGFFSHLLLDEIWSVNLVGKGPMVKKSFGSALKFFGPTTAGNSACYGILILLSLVVVQDAQHPAAIRRAPRIVAPDDDPPPRHATRRHRDVIFE